MQKSQLQHESQGSDYSKCHIYRRILQFEILFSYNCSNALLILLWSVYAPFCGSTSTNSSTSVILKPCRNICNHVYDGCIGVFNEFQYQWPEILTCENFPQEVRICVLAHPIPQQYHTQILSVLILLFPYTLHPIPLLLHQIPQILVLDLYLYQNVSTRICRP